MADFVPITPGVGANIETLEQPDGRQRQGMHMADFLAALHNVLEEMANPIHVDNQARMRVSIENIGGSLTLSTITTIGTVTTVNTVASVTNVGTVAAVTTVGTLTNQTQLGGKAADSMVMDSMTAMWAHAIRGRIQ